MIHTSGYHRNQYQLSLDQHVGWSWSTSPPSQGEELHNPVDARFPRANPARGRCGSHSDPCHSCYGLLRKSHPPQLLAASQLSDPTAADPLRVLEPTRSTSDVPCKMVLSRLPFCQSPWSVAQGAPLFRHFLLSPIVFPIDPLPLPTSLFPLLSLKRIEEEKPNRIRSSICEEILGFSFLHPRGTRIPFVMFTCQLLFLIRKDLCSSNHRISIQRII